MRAAIAALVFVSVGLAQPVEHPASFDTHGNVMKLTPDINRQAAVFPDLTSFDYSELWQSDSGYVADVYFQDGSRQRRPLTSAELDQIRQRVDARVTQATSSPRLNQEGRGRFLFEQIPLALGWYGPAVLLIVEPSDGRALAALYLLSASACYFAPMMLTSHVRMTPAQAHLSVAYGYRGVLAGYLLSDVLQIHSQYEGPRWNAFVMLPVSIAGQAAGRRLADPLTLGQATLVSSYTDLGTMGGFLGGFIIEQTFYRDNFKSTLLSLSTLLGMAGGAVAGNVRARRWDCTEGQVVADRTGGLLGAAVPAAFYYALTGAQLFHRSREYDRTDWEVLSVLGIGGAAGGTWWTETRLRDLPLTTSGGYIVAGTTVGGALLGAGAGFVVSDEGRVVAATATAGGVAGFLGGLSLAKSLQGTQSGQSSLREPRIEVNCAALTGAAASYAGSRTFSAPHLVTIRF